MSRPIVFWFKLKLRKITNKNVVQVCLTDIEDNYSRTWTDQIPLQPSETMIMRHFWLKSHCALARTKGSMNSIGLGQDPALPILENSLENLKLWRCALKISHIILEGRIIIHQYSLKFLFLAKIIKKNNFQKESVPNKGAL